ncbi:hypothetical protein HRbin01_00353 [archaeon HR01]|nr:hypothetical protein HRbin01_00353 [archaeon HR01]
MSANPNSYLKAVGVGRLSLSIGVQIVLGFFMAHGYDYRVSYVAGRNIAQGTSPYLGGVVEGFLSSWYGRDVQGIGETPLWALYTGVSYILSDGDIHIFNLILKIPIIGCNFLLSYLAVKRGCDPRFFLLNPFALLVTASWGKPDNISTYFSIVPLLLSSGLVATSLLFTVSLMVKPLGLPIFPALVGKYSSQSRVRAIIMATMTIALSTAFFFLPFMVFRWPFQTVLEGAANWLKPTGGISPYNIIEAVYGTTTLPENLATLGYAPFVALAILTILISIHPPKHPQDTLSIAITSTALFLSLRPWVSEQNLYIILALMVFTLGKLPTRLLWIIPTIFAVANLSIIQNLYLILAPTSVETPDIYPPVRLWVKFLISIGWLALIWWTIASKRLYRW